MNDSKYKGKRYICIARASDAPEGSSSTDAQLKLLNEAAKKLGMVPVEDIALNNLTGSLPGKRDDLDQLLARKRSRNDFDVLVLQRIDRLTRGGADHGFWFEHECRRAGIELLFIGDDIPEGRYASLIKVAKFEAAQEQAFSISQRSTQGSQHALEDGRVITSSHTPYGCWRLYLASDGSESHIIRDLRDGRQQKLDARSREVIDTYGEVGGGSKGHYRKQKTEKVLLIPGDSAEVEVVREIFRLHFLQGWGGKRIADLLNSRSIRSPQGRGWSQHQVEVIYEQEVYTGRSVGNRISSSIYHERASNAPKAANVDPAIRATARSIPVRHRHPNEWYIQPQPRMAEFLEPAVRKLAEAEHERIWKTRWDPTREKQSRSRHKASDYLLTGLLVAKQDGEPLTGVLCGRVGKKVRYYRHRRGRRGYRTGSIFNRLLQAEPLERAVIGILQEVLADIPLLRERILRFAVEQSSTAENQDGKLEELRDRREKLRRRTELIVSTLDEETLADARLELDRLGAQRRQLDEQIAGAEAAEQARTISPEEIADTVAARLQSLSAELKSMPTFALRQMLGTLIEKVVADMETRQIEIHIAVPAMALAGLKQGEITMRPVGSSASSASHETHQGLTITLGFADCTYVKLQRSVCFECRRRAA